jgi:hypothetical protein
MKQETLEEAAREYYKRGQLGFEAASDTERAFINGAKWQQKNSYSEEEVLDILGTFLYTLQMGEDVEDVKLWFEQFKNK